MFVCASASADSITFVGSPIALRNCRVQSIQGGQLVFLNPSGQRQQRSLDDVNALSLEGLTTLDDAEKLIAAGDLEAGVRRLMQAALAVDSEMQRLWVHSRLARIHDARGQYVEAAGHAAIVFAMTDDPYWRKLEPVSEPRDASFAAASESLAVLQNASGGGGVRSTSLKASVDRMVKIVRPMHDRLAADYTGPPIAPGSTISGIPKSELARSPSPSIANSTPPSSTPKAKATPKQIAPSPKPPAPAAPSTAPPELEPVSSAAAHESKSPVAIEALLTQQQFAEALTVCQRLESNPGDRDLAQFLWQFGRALAGTGKSRDTAIMLTRCGLLYPASAHAGPSLIDAAKIHRDAFADVPAATRLLQRALELAQQNDQPVVADQARKALQSLNDPTAHKEP